MPAHAVTGGQPPRSSSPSYSTAHLLFLFLCAAPVLILAALCRGAEYDEQYTLFLTGPVTRPVWGPGPLLAGDVIALQAPVFDPVGLAQALRTTDVHPPLYFWAISAWRALVAIDPRGLSVLCSLAALALVGRLAERLNASAMLAMALTLGCYGFVYTSVIARGFAPATLALLAGAMLLSHPTRSRPGLAGLAFGVASGVNYLAVFAAAGFTLGHARRVSTLVRVGAGMAPAILLDLSFFLAQRNARPDQFPPFDPMAALPRLGRYLVANMFGGLPLYVQGSASLVVSALIVTLSLGLGLVIARHLWRQLPEFHNQRSRLLLALTTATAAQPIGLVALGLLFNNTPIELRYLAFVVPFAMLLLASALGTLSPGRRRIAATLVLAVQAASIVGLMLAPETMQPARATARSATALGADGVVLIPHGNDGVGIVGAFAREAPAQTRLLIVRATDEAASIRDRVAGESRVVIAAMAQDDDSRATIPTMRAALSGPCWRFVADGPNTTAFDRVCDQP